MPDSIFHESIRQGITCSVSFCLFVVRFRFFSVCVQGDTSVFLRKKEMESVLSR